MVRVVVEHVHTARLATMLEPPSRAREACELRLGLLSCHSHELQSRERGGRVSAVVLARQGQLEVDRLQLLPTDDLRNLGEPALEELIDLGARGELRMVIEVDIRDDRDLRAQLLDRPVGLVALDDEPPRARPGVAGELRDLTADQEGGISAESVERER